MKIFQRNSNRSTFFVWEMWPHHNMCWKWPPFASRRDRTRRAMFWKVLASTSAVTAWISSVMFNTFVNQLDDEELNWIFPAGRSDIPHFTRQHGRNSVLFRRPLLFEGTLATALARSDAAWLFLMGISERESLPKQTTTHRRLESKYRRRNSGSDSGRTGEDFPKYGAPGSVLSGRKWWPLPAHVMMSSRFSHNERTTVQISFAVS